MSHALATVLHRGRKAASNIMSACLASSRGHASPEHKHRDGHGDGNGSGAGAGYGALYSAAMNRVSWERYFMNLAVQAATRSTCPRKSVGAVIVRDKTVLSTGYNGSIRGAAHCTEVGCLMENDHCVRTVHAEANALVQAACHGTRLEDGQIFVTASPCFHCFKLIVNSGIRSIYFGEFYRDERVIQFADELGIEMIHLGLADETGDE
jgi:dCMP deaminase